jgi:hypothetical protein
VIEYAKAVYLRENIDFLIQVFGEKHTGKECKGIVRDVVDVMEQQGRNLVLNILSGDTKDGATEKEVVC